MSTKANDALTVADSRGDEILHAAFDVFTEKGFHEATMLDVASLAQASKATLYARFSNKESLLAAVVAWRLRRAVTDLEVIANDNSLDAVLALRRFGQRLLAQMLDPQTLALFRLVAGVGLRLPQIGKVLSPLNPDPGTLLGSHFVDRLVQKRRIAIDDREEFTRAFVGLLLGELFMGAVLGAGSPATSEEISAHADRVVDRLLRAFAPSPGRKTPPRPESEAAGTLLLL